VLAGFLDPIQLLVDVEKALALAPSEPREGDLLTHIPIIRAITGHFKTTSGAVLGE
jgi:hypothetical protein